MIYLDNNATTRPTPGVADAIDAATRTLWANPSSVHRAGQEVRHALELARAELAALLGVSPKELVLTASGTESIDLAIRGSLESPRARSGVQGDDHRATGRSGPPVVEPPPNIVTTAIEHAAVRDLTEHLERQGRIETRTLPVHAQGTADPGALDALIDDHTALVTVQWANNETGAIQPIERIAQICGARSVPLHVDAVQWVGKMPFEPASSPLARAPALPCDLLTLSAHKFHGPKGVGALWIKRGASVVPQTIGTQEMDRRGGTESVPSVVGAGVAAREATEWLADPAPRPGLEALRDRFERVVCDGFPGATVNGAKAPRLWNTSNIGFPKLESEALLMLLSERGVAASAGAACSSGSLEPSPVLLAMGVPEHLAHGSVRFSLSRETTEDQLDQAARIVIESAHRLAGSSDASLSG